LAIYQQKYYLDTSVCIYQFSGSDANRRMSLGGGYVYPLILNEAANIHNSLKNYKLHYKQHCSNQYLEIVLSEFPISILLYSILPVE
jgi:hypothetical protein